MIIKQHYHVGDTLQRSIVTRGGTIHRRIARYVDQAGELTPQILDAPVWQERQHNGDFHNVSESYSKTLEKAFIDTLIKANGLA